MALLWRSEYSGEDVAVVAAESTTTALWANPLALAPFSDRVESRVLRGTVVRRSFDRVPRRLPLSLYSAAREGPHSQ